MRRRLVPPNPELVDQGRKYFCPLSCIGWELDFICRQFDGVGGSITRVRH
jgi:hypothetical protein